MAMAGPLPLVIFEPLPSDSRTKWATHHEYIMDIEPATISKSPIAIRRSVRRLWPSGFGRDFGPSRFGAAPSARGPIGRGSAGGHAAPTTGAKQVKKLPVVEDTHYTIEDRSGDLVTIVKKYEMKAQEPGGKMSLKMSGQGKLTFDAKVGLPKKMDYQGTIEISQGNVSVKFPVTLAYEQTDGKTAPEPAAVAGTLPPCAGPSASGPARVAAARPARPAPAVPDKEFVPVASQGGKLAVRASGIEGNKTPDLAFDGDKKTAWGAAAGPFNGSRPTCSNRPA